MDNEKAKTVTNEATEAQKTESPKKDIKIVLPLMLLLTVGVITTLILTAPKKEDRTINVSSDYDKSVLVPVSKDKKFGYVDLGGNMIIEPKYDYAHPFGGDYAIAYTDNLQKQIVIDRSGNTIHESQKIRGISYYDNQKLWYDSGYIYDKDFNLIGELVEGGDLDSVILVRKNENGRKLITAFDLDGQELYTIESNSKYPIVSIAKTPSEKLFCAIQVQDDNLDTAENEGVSEIINCETGKILVENIPYELESSYDYSAFTYNDYNTQINGYYLIDDAENVIHDEAVFDEWTYYDFMQKNSPTSGYYEEIMVITDNIDYYENVSTKYYIYSTGELVETEPETFESLNPNSGYHDYEAGNERVLSIGDYIAIENNEQRLGLRKGNDVVLDCEYDHIDDIIKINSKGEQLISVKKDGALYILNIDNGEIVYTDIKGYNDQISDFLMQPNGNNLDVFNVETGKSISVYFPKSNFTKYYNGYTSTKDWVAIYNKKTKNLDYYNKNLELFYYGDYYDVR